MNAERRSNDRQDKIQALETKPVQLSICQSKTHID